MGETADYPIMPTTRPVLTSYASVTTPPKHLNSSTEKPLGGDESIVIIICAVGGFLLLTVLVIIILFCCKRRRRRRAVKKQQPSIIRGDMSINSALFDTGQVNPGLQLSDQDIPTSLPSSTLEKRRETIVCEDVFPPPYDQDEEYESKLIESDNTRDISIKLLTPWNDVYKKTESDEYFTMKNYIESSMKTIYASYDEFESVTLLQFRQGSLISDIQLKFSMNALEPLLPLERAVRSGKCADLVVDNNFFQIHRSEIGIVDGFSEKILNQPKEKVLNKHNVSAKDEAQSRRDLKVLKRESGYGSVDFDPAELQNKLDKHQNKIRECSTKSTESRDSVTSEMGTSYSISPKSLSSTNISIHSCADEEIHHLEHSHNRRKGLFPSLPRPGKRHDPNKNKPNAIVTGEPHMALFDFKPQDYRELALHQGEMLRVTYIDNGGWVKAVNEQNIQGWVPHNFVTPIDPEKYNTIKRSVEVVALIDDVVDQEIDNMLNGDDDDDDDNEGYYSVPRPQKPKPHQSEYEEGDDSDLSSEDICALFVVIFPFDPSEKNELKLEVGDLIDVLKTDETGWWKGRCLKTKDDGWFPSSYVKPYSPEMNFEIQEEDKGTVSDSEVHKISSTVIKNQRKEEGGYSSDNGEARTMKAEPVRSNKLEVPANEHSNIQIEKAEPEATCNVNANGVKLRPKGVEPPKKRAVSLIIDIDSGNGKVHFPAPLTPPPRLSAHRDHGNNNMFPDPPSKPVPPKPRTRHIEKTYRNLVAAGKLGSTDSLKTVSTECLVNLGRSPQKDGSWKSRRRNSEDANLLSADIVRIRDFGSKSVSRARPKSFQETPKNSFFYLANRYVNMKPACSLPTLVGDQIKLSPDDDRPFLDPIPRKAKSRSFRNDEPSLKDDVMSKRISSSMKDLSLVIDPQDYRPILEPIPRKSKKSTNKSETYTQPMKGSYENEKGYTVTKHENKYTVEVPTLKLSQSSKTNIKTGVHVDTSPSKPLPPVPTQPEVLTTNKNPPAVTPKPVLPSNSILSQLLTDRTIAPNVPVTRPPLIAQKPTVPVRTTSKNFGAKKLIEEHRARQTNIPNNNSHTRGPLVGGRLRTQRHFSSFESINEEAEQASTPKDESLNLPIEHDHRRSRSEPHERILKTELNYVCSQTNHSNTQSLSPPISLTCNSRASSLQSLNSVASSARSTSSSKHEQANLRRAVMNVRGQGRNDLSFNSGAILYELRPKNKQGLCFGILEDSTQGWFPAESVEVFQQDEF